MSISISSRTAVYAAQTMVKPGPKAIPFPREETVGATSPARGVSQAPTIAPGKADFGATIDTKPAQDPPGPAQEGVGAGGEPPRDPGLQDEPGVFADITGDGELNREDINALLTAFNSSVTAADLNADGTVDTADLGILINAIRELNSKSTPETSPLDNPIGNVTRISAVDLPPAPEPVTRPQPGSLDPGDPEVIVPGNHDDPVSQPGMFGDLTGDGIVNEDDLSILRESFGQSGAVGDLNGDGRVDTADLGTILGILNRQSNP